MPIVFQVHYKDGSTSAVKEWIEKQTQTVSILNEKNKDIDFVLFDPNYQIIKTVEFKKSLEELRAQASKAPNMIDRYDALKEMAAEKFEDKKDFLIELFKKEPFHANRAEIAKQLVKHADKLEVATIQLLVNDKHARVRQSTIDNIDDIPAEFFSAYEKLLTDSSYNVVEKTLTELAKQNPEKLQQYLDITKNDMGVGSSVKVKWHLLATEIDRQKNIDALVKLSSSQYEFRTRGSALNALKQLNYLDNALLENLFNALTHFNTRLNAPAKKVAEYFMEQKEHKDKLTAYYNSNTWQPHEKEKLKSIFDK
jgi:HEAT repeat protein